MDFYEEEPTQVELNPNPALRTGALQPQDVQLGGSVAARVMLAL